MINYIRSEIYRNLRNKSNYFLILGMMAFVMFLNVVLWIFSQKHTTFPYATTKYAFSSIYTGLQFPLVMCWYVAGNIFGQEYKNETFKNSISVGISKDSIYFGKIFISIIYSLITMILVMGVFVISAYMLLENSGIEHLETLIKSLLVAIPVLLFSLIVANCFNFIVKKEINAMWYCMAIVMIIPILLKMIGKKSEAIKVIANYMPWNFISSIGFNQTTNKVVLGWTTPDVIIKSIVVGVIGSILFYFIGLEIFKRKDIR